ncbi:putative quinol monooxygenase [Actinoplanes sp. NPDC024001]|uniref:putative quinol monooxygenase n=1 Tax=Actinoplanes sp. NPDC024001 TaxID=3154598 RepID=UPI003410A0CA
MKYGYFGSMKTKPGHRDEVVSILLRSSDGLREAGCHLYVVGVSGTDDQTIWVNEVWESKEHHDASLQLPETRAAIAEAMPLLTGEFTQQEISVLGGLGLPAAP